MYRPRVLNVFFIQYKSVTQCELVLLKRKWWWDRNLVSQICVSLYADAMLFDIIKRITTPNMCRIFFEDLLLYLTSSFFCQVGTTDYRKLKITSTGQPSMAYCLYQISYKSVHRVLELNHQNGKTDRQTDMASPVWVHLMCIVHSVANRFNIPLQYYVLWYQSSWRDTQKSACSMFYFWIALYFGFILKLPWNLERLSLLRNTFFQH
jgi:hypothetical protein